MQPTNRIDSTFSAAETLAYQALSRYLLVDSAATDIRSVYPTRIDQANGWYMSLDNPNEMNIVASQVPNQRDQTCFNTVVTQLSAEIRNVSYVDLWYTKVEYMDNRISFSMQAAMDSAYTALSITSKQQIIPNPKHSPNWLEVILGVLTLASRSAAIFGAPTEITSLLTLLSATSNFVVGAVNGATSTTSTANIQFTENTMLDLKYSDLLKKTPSTI